jgi:hypothetical protein
MSKKTRSVTGKSAPTFAGIQRAATEFNPDYTNVKNDLKRIAVLACTFFVILIALTFILPFFIH